MDGIRYLLVVASTIVFGLTGAAVVARRVEVVGSQQVSGDFAVWITVHELIKRGHVLYRDVWDHKDPGFFFLSHYFFEGFGVKGLYLCALVATLLFAIGVFLVMRGLVGATVASAIAAGGVIYYADLPSYWSTYTENYSMGVLALGLGLVPQFPLVAGGVLALACTVKLSSVVVVFTLVTLALLRRLLVPVTLRCLWRFLVGFALGTLIFARLYGNDFDFPSWLEVIAFNKEYAQRRAPPFQWSDWRTLLVSAPRHIQWVLGVFLIEVIGGAILWFRSHGNTRHDTLLTAELIAIAMVLGGIGAMMLQYPPSSQHWQFLGGAAVFGACLMTAFLVSLIPWRGMRIVVLTGLCVPALIHAQTSLAFIKGGTWLQLYRMADEPANLRAVIKQLPEDTTFAIIGGNDNRLDFSEAPQSLRLVCRLFYQYGLASPRFDTDINSCLDKSPSVVFLNKNHRLPVVQGVVDRLQTEYVVCAQPPGVYTVFGRTSEVCLGVRG